MLNCLCFKSQQIYKLAQIWPVFFVHYSSITSNLMQGWMICATHVNSGLQLFKNFGCILICLVKILLQPSLIFRFSCKIVHSCAYCITEWSLSRTRITDEGTMHLHSELLKVLFFIVEDVTFLSLSILLSTSVSPTLPLSSLFHLLFSGTPSFLVLLSF